MAKAMSEATSGGGTESVFRRVSLVATITFVRTQAILQRDETKVIKKAASQKKSRYRLTFVHEVETFFCDKGT